MGWEHEVGYFNGLLLICDGFAAVESVLQLQVKFVELISCLIVLLKLIDSAEEALVLFVLS